MKECIELLNEIYESYMNLYYETDSYKKYFKDMTEDEYRYLYIIYRKEKMKPSELSKIVKISKPAVTKIVQKFIRKNYIYKVENDNDKRAFYITLNEELKNNIEKSDKEYEKILEKEFSILSKDEIKQLKTLMNKIAKGGK